MYNISYMSDDAFFPTQQTRSGFGNHCNRSQVSATIPTCVAISWTHSYCHVLRSDMLSRLSVVWKRPTIQTHTKINLEYKGIDTHKWNMCMWIHWNSSCWIMRAQGVILSYYNESSRKKIGKEKIKSMSSMTSQRASGWLSSVGVSCKINTWGKRRCRSSTATAYPLPPHLYPVTRTRLCVNRGGPHGLLHQKHIQNQNRR